MAKLISSNPGLHSRFTQNVIFEDYSDDELTERFKASIRIDNEIKRVKGTPIAGYDVKKRQAYLEYADGRREYAES